MDKDDFPQMIRDFQIEQGAKALSEAVMAMLPRRESNAEKYRVYATLQPDGSFALIKV